MSEPSFDWETGLRFECPRCGAWAEDELEALDALVPTDWRCEQCDRCFSVLLVECASCASEIVSVALQAAEQPELEAVVCGECGENCIDHGEATSTQ